MVKWSNLDEQHIYEDYWNGKWKCNVANPEQWVNISSILLSFPVWKNIRNKSQINIPTTYVGRVKIILMLLMH
jgi:hypothetical protein